MPSPGWGGGGAMTIWHYGVMRYALPKLAKQPRMVLIVERKNHFTCPQMRARSYQASSFANAARVRTASTPVVRMPTWRSSNLATVAAGQSPRPARDYYLQGSSQRSIQAYETYLARNPQAGAGPREELAWVYADSGYTTSAVREYRTALSQYRSDLDRQHNVEAAKHGVRTCESAVDALETR